MSESRLRPLFLDTKGLDLQGLESFGNDLVEYQRGIMWWIGDCARAAERISPDNWAQCFPEGPPDMLSRCMAVAKAYPNESDRNPLASWTTHMREANKPDRIQRVQAHADAGRTSDEANKANQEERLNRWLLAIDVNYYLHRFYHSGAGVEAASCVAQWIERTVDRMKHFRRQLTDVVCCFDSSTNHRKELTKDWEDKYKDRPPKAPELVQQLHAVRDLLHGQGFLCVSQEGMEADDLLASYASQFQGDVTILSQDKDVRQCLSGTCNILLDVDWNEDPTSGEMIPSYQWITAKQHTDATGIRPGQWPDYQAIMGDNVDGIKGVSGIGEKGAADLIREFGTVEGAIQAAKDGDERIKPKKREALIEFEQRLDITRQLVTLKRNLPVPSNTRI
jgi:5'-3' exonuclease